jgi:hypothetical protein
MPKATTVKPKEAIKDRLRSRLDGIPARPTGGVAGRARANR